MSGHRLPYDWGKAPFRVLDPGDAGTIKVDRSLAYVPLVSGAADETRTLGRPTRMFQRIVLAMKTDGGGAIAVTVTGGFDEAGRTTLTFTDAGGFAELLAVEDSTTTLVWRVVGHDGVAGPMVNSATVATAHAAGVIGTATAPATTRRTENGTIITEFKIDLTGLASKDTANDVIGLAAGGVAYIGRNVVADNGIIYAMELVCIEAPAGGDTDINIVVASSATLEYDGAGGTTYGVNGGVQAAGQVVQNLVQGLTAGHYFYLTTGAGATAGAYTAGMFICRWYGHALI